MASAAIGKPLQPRRRGFDRSDYTSPGRRPRSIHGNVTFPASTRRRSKTCRDQASTTERHDMGTSSTLNGVARREAGRNGCPLAGLARWILPVQGADAVIGVLPSWAQNSSTSADALRRPGTLVAGTSASKSDPCASMGSGSCLRTSWGKGHRSKIDLREPVTSGRAARGSAAGAPVR
jgi:hypothetical protein